MAMANIGVAVFLLCMTLFSRAFASSSSDSVKKTTVSYDGRALVINGQRRLLVSGSIHYPRSTPEMWQDLIAKSKAGGLDVIETYVFWNLHEPQPRQYNFEGRLDLVRFLKEVQNAGLYANLRIGPYVCAEWNLGGFPVWLEFLPGIKLRTHNERYMLEMKVFTTKIVDMMKQEKLFASQGGPIILAQIENEYGNMEEYYGDSGISYIQWAADFALSLNTSVPWIMCQQANAPGKVINTCNGFYCDGFIPNKLDSPTMWTENWAGWFKSFGDSQPHRPAEDLAFSVARFYQRGGTFQNYYMYHGGTNFNRTSGGPFITTSYDYDAPIDEFGDANQPKWGHLQDLHKVLKLSEKAITYGSKKTIITGDTTQATVYEIVNGSCIAFLSNQDVNNTNVVRFRGKTYHLPPWSVSILPDCVNDVYNTAKISAQTSVVKTHTVALNAQDSITKWSWFKESVGSIASNSFSANGLLEQLQTTMDVSDYLWYSKSFNLTKHDLKHSKSSLVAVTRGHQLTVYVNGKLAGTQIGNYSVPNFVFHKTISLREGENQIDLLSATVGLKNYGPYFDTARAGIKGPVTIMGLQSGVKDLSKGQWKYQVGLAGEQLRAYTEEGVKAVQWKSGTNPPKQTDLIWYRTQFDTPEGKHTVALDLSSMSKGQVWVNGNNIGRYYSAAKAPKDGCSGCDYTGSYDASKCVYDCGKPTQTLYHVPRSWLNSSGKNVLVLLEEIAGDPTRIVIRTRHVDTACAVVSSDSVNLKSVESVESLKTQKPSVELQCSEGEHIEQVKFASFGNPSGSCGNFKKGSCHAENSVSVIEKECVGKENCSVLVSEELFGNSCSGLATSLAVEVMCSS